MIAKEKAEEMLKTFDNIPRYAKKAVDEILKVSISYAGKDYDYWQEVKQEIEKL